MSMTEDETSTGNVRLERLLPVLTKVMLEKKYRSQPETVLMQAFETLDVDKKGYLLPSMYPLCNLGTIILFTILMRKKRTQKSHRIS